MPVYNAASTLAATLQSIHQQTFSNYEIIAIDDGSEDQSGMLLEQYTATDPRLRFWRRPYLGLVDCLNFGLEHCRGSLVARMDADDLMLPERLQKQVDYLNQNPQVTLVASQVKIFSEQPIGSGWLKYLHWQNQCVTPKQIADNIYWEAPFVHPSVMFRKQQIINIGGYRNGAFPEDYELWLRLHAGGLLMTKIPQVLLHWREHAMRLTHTDPRLSAQGFSLPRLNYLVRDPRVINANNVVIWGAGRKTRQRLKPLTDHSSRISAWVDIDPAKIGNKINNLPVLAPEMLKEFNPKPLVLVAVRSHGAKELIEKKLLEFDYQIGVDYLAVG